MADGSFVEGHAVEKQPAVQRLSVLLLSVGVEGSGERTAAAEETHRQGEESAARTARQVRGLTSVLNTEQSAREQINLPTPPTLSCLYHVSCCYILERFLDKQHPPVST